MYTFNIFIAYVEMHGDFTWAYNFFIAYIEIETHIVKQEHVFSGYKPYFVYIGWNERERVNKSVFIKEISFSNAYFVIDITGIHYSQQT